MSDCQAQVAKIKWFSKGTNNRVMFTLKAGDVIEFVRDYCSYWAVCVTSNQSALVVYLQDADAAIPGSTLTAGQIGKVRLQLIVGDSNVRINNDDDRKRAPLPINDIKGRAMRAFKGQYLPKNVVSLKSEQFAKWCRYGSDLHDDLHCDLPVNVHSDFEAESGNKRQENLNDERHPENNVGDEKVADGVDATDTGSQLWSVAGAAAAFGLGAAVATGLSYFLSESSKDEKKEQPSGKKKRKGKSGKS